MESVWGTLKNALVPHRRSATREQARRESTGRLSSCAITVSGDIRGEAIAPRRPLPSRGSVSRRRREAATHGVHY
jgi:hypothetical protein